MPTDNNRNQPVLRSLAILAIVLATARTTGAQEKRPAASAENPARIAQRPNESKPAEFDLKYKLKRGEVLRYEVNDRASFNTTIEQSTMATQTKTLTVKAWKITDVLPNGEIEFINVVERVKMTNQLPDHDPVEYDSERDSTPPPGYEDVAKSIGVPLIAIRMTPRGKIIRRDWKTRAPKADENAPIAVRLPDEPVVIGDTWDEPFDVQVTLENESVKSIQTRRHYKLAKVAHGIATIEVSYQVLSPIDAFVEYQLLQRLMQGEVQFDIKAGRVVAQKMEIDKRILGFAGPTSSTHYIMRMEENLLKANPSVARSRPAKRTSNQSPTARARQNRTAR